MKILFVIGTLGMGGAEAQVVQLANLLGKRGFEVHIGVLNLGLPEQKLKIESYVQIHDLQLRFFKRPFNSIYRLPKFIYLLRKFDFKIVYSFMPEAIMVSFPIVRMFSTKSTRIAGIRGSIIRRGTALQQLFFFLLRNGNYTVFNSDFLAQKYIREFRLDPTKVRTIHNGVALNVGLANTNLTPPKGIVIANFHPYKGYETLIYAISQIREDCHFYFIGAGVLMPEMKKLVAALDLESKIDFLGNIDPLEHLLKSQFSVHPSVSEGLSNAILEELACGLPVIASDIPENYPLVSNHINGILVKPSSPDSFREAISLMVREIEMRERMGRESQKKAQEFSWEDCLFKHIDFFKSI